MTHQARTLAAGLVALALGACGGPASVPGVVSVATSWNAAECAAIGEAFGAPIRWVVLAPGDAVERLASRRSPPDVLLGGDPATFERLFAAGKLAPADSGEPAWRLVARPDLEEPQDLGDPRLDPHALARINVRLQDGEWAEGYAALVRGDAGGPRRRGRAEGVAVPAGSGRPQAGKAFLAFLERTGRLTPAAERGRDADDFTADLLGSVLVDAADELAEARESLKTAHDPGRSRRWMAEPPPWPPASVAKILDREPNPMAMVETLAAQVAPDADTRGWILRSWVAPGRPVNGVFLEEIARACEGRLAREPRFRAWLRGEWTAWARQRFRRVARSAEPPVAESTTAPMTPPPDAGVLVPKEPTTP